MMSDALQGVIRRLCLLVPMLVFWASVVAQPTVNLAPFTTDGCSMFPDHSLVSETDWCSCCVEHDLAYWRGGSETEREAADQGLRQCVQRSTGDTVLAELMYAGVRAGGEARFPTSYRWGYGWPYGRGYTPLTGGERAVADEQEARYRAANPKLSCPR